MNREFRVVDGGGSNGIPYILELRVRRLIRMIDGEPIFVDTIIMYQNRRRTDSYYNPNDDAPIRA